MHSCRDVITSALRRSGVLRSGGIPTASNAADGLASLQSFYMECISQGTFGRVYDVVVSEPGSVTPYGNQHVNITVDDAVTVDLPKTLPADHWDTWRPCRDYGWGLNIPVGGDPNITTPRDLSVVVVTSEFNDDRAYWVYDTTVQRWMLVNNLTLDDEAPLSARGYEGLSSVLALRLSADFGGDLLAPVTISAANKYKVALVSRHGSRGDC